ncbi:hypothetical protein NMD1_04100 [Novosphingobium sp. MD-1]|nr:hypothetical protein NMD1_04100 [Novosphingobium sp. MD-1]
MQDTRPKFMVVSVCSPLVFHKVFDRMARAIPDREPHARQGR